MAFFWNEDYHYLKGKAKLELGADDRDLEIDQVRVGSGIVVTGIPSHVVVLALQRNVVLQQRHMIFVWNLGDLDIISTYQTLEQQDPDAFEAMNTT